MERSSASGVSFQRWNRKILNAYWTVFFLSFLAELAGFFLEAVYDKIYPPGYYLTYYVALPTALLAVILTAVEWYSRTYTRFNDYLMITTGSSIVFILVLIHSSMDGVQFLFLLPMLASVFYFQPRKVAFSFLVNVLAFGAAYSVSSILRSELEPIEFVTTVIVLICGLILTYGIMSRGVEIQRELVRTMEDQQELLVKAVLMDKVAKTDALTELYNHKTFHEYLDKLIDQCERNGLILHLAVLDIDNFKKINDTFGHWVGDLVLRRVSQVIRSTVSNDDFAARYGGEEFAILFTDKSSEIVLQIAEEIRVSLAEWNHEELLDRSVTISIGLKEYEPGDGKEALFRGADTALYTAKRNGKNRTVVHSDELEMLPSQ